MRNTGNIATSIAALTGTICDTTGKKVRCRSHRLDYSEGHSFGVPFVSRAAPHASAYPISLLIADS